MPGPLKKKSICHPDRGQWAKGLCASCYRTKMRRAAKLRNPEHVKKVLWRSHIKQSYGLSEEALFDLQQKQNNLCALCKAATKLHIDHDHVTGKVRGLLCHRCNIALAGYEAMRNTTQVEEYLGHNRDSIITS